MISNQGLDDRQLVPRWRTFKDSAALGELASAKRDRLDGPSPADLEAISKFEESPGLHTASDALGIAASVDNPEFLLPVVRFVEESHLATPLITDLAASVRRRITKEAVSLSNPWANLSERQSAIQQIRAELRMFPRNPTRWVDLALAQTLIGQVERAERSLRTAVSLAPLNRFVLRSAVRFFLHIDDPESAQQVIHGARNSSDPWLLAAELATDEAAGDKPHSMRTALTVLTSDNFSTWTVSELACTVAHFEFNEGNQKRGRKILGQATAEPTENAAAQIEFESQRGGFSTPQSFQLPYGSYEATAIKASGRHDWKVAIEAGQKWQRDQPFAVEPAMFLSYVASVGAEDYVAAEEAAALGRIANPRDPILANNLVFAIANQNKSVDVDEIFSHSAPPRDASEEAVHLATRGLVSFREGRADLGREYYQRATRQSLDLGLREQAAIAASYWAREEALISSQVASDIWSVANNLAEETNKRDAKLILSRVLGAVSGRRDSSLGVVQTRSSIDGWGPSDVASLVQGTDEDGVWFKF
ncbi:tetratricopeptide repeat protein [Arthrobacter sp. MDT1-48-3]